MSQIKTAVIGNGWAALGTVGFLVAKGDSVVWIKGSGARIQPTTAGMPAGLGVEAWIDLAQVLGIDCGDFTSGSLLREFRNKAFREPVWTKAIFEERVEAKAANLWSAEQNLAGVQNSRFKESLLEIEEKIRERLTPEIYPHLNIISDNSVTGFKGERDCIKSVTLGSGEEIDCDQVIYADRWSMLPLMTGLPKPLTFLRQREPIGLLQASFSHDVPLGLEIQESFFAAMHKDAGEKMDKHVWGYFTSDGKRSVWTISLSIEEEEDNHTIAKRFRKLKSTLDRIFTKDNLLPEGAETFSSTVAEEHVMFEEDILMADHLDVSDPVTLKKLSGISFLTDGYGPESALRQVSRRLARPQFTV
jgi:hypothetical protein